MVSAVVVVDKTKGTETVNSTPTVSDTPFVLSQEDVVEVSYVTERVFVYAELEYKASTTVVPRTIGLESPIKD